MTSKQPPRLTEDQARHVARAREVLAEPFNPDAAAMAARAGALQWHLGEMLDLIDQLTGGES